MSDKSYKHYQFLQEKKKRQRDKEMAEFDAMSNAYKRAEKFIRDGVKLLEQLKEQKKNWKKEDFYK